jgi:subtilisin family serine protease
MILSLLACVFAKRYIVVSETNDDLLSVAQPGEYKYNVLHQSHTIGNLRFDVISSDEYPYHLYGNQNVYSVEEDLEVNIKGVDVEDVEAEAYRVQRNPIWGLDRIDQRNNQLNQKYFYQVNAGANSTVYVVDTGIDIKHPEFEGRATWGYDATGDGQNNLNSHGTHCAGTIGSKTYGVAKKVNLVAVRVLGSDGSGTMSGVIAGLEYVAKQSASKKIVSMSLGGGYSVATNRAVAELVRQGIIVVAAAGNEDSDACGSSPASEPSAITVGATDSKTVIAGFSNWGTCVDVFAPGVDILSTVPGGKTGTMSGTSMATPHVAGIVALIIDNAEKYTPSQVHEFIKTQGTVGKIGGDLKCSPNVLAFSIPSL